MGESRKRRKESKVEQCFQLDLKNQCLFCLQPTGTGGYRNVKDVKCFEPLRLLHYFTGTKSIYFENDTSTSVSSKIPKMEVTMPPLCHTCHEHFGELQNLHEQLSHVQCLIKNQVRKIQQAISDTLSPSPRVASRKWKAFKEKLSSTSVGRKEIVMTYAFVRNLHFLITETGLSHKAQIDDWNATNILPFDKEFQPKVKEEMTMDIGEEDFDPSWSPSAFDDLLRSVDDDVDPILEKDDKLSLTAHTKREKIKKAKLKSGSNTAKRTRKKGTTLAMGVRTQQSCDLCGIVFPISEMFEHMQGHVKDFATKCLNSWCPYVFSCKLKLEKHLSQTTCGKKANLKTNGKMSLKKCEYCDFETMATNITLLNHLRTHEEEANGKVTLNCPIDGCTEAFALSQTLDCHIFYHNLRSVTTQKCTICKEEINVVEIENHLTESHQVEVNETFKCRLCPFVFDNVEARIEHLNDHRNETGVPCDICDDETSRFRRMELLRLHFFNTHSLGKLPAYICQYCGSEYPSHRYLKYHLRVKHSAEVAHIIPKNVKKYSYKCEMCADAREFASKSSLQNHKIRDHGAEPLPCKFCSETFISADRLRNHLKEHTGINLTFKCKVEGCEKGYATRTMLRAHERDFHESGNRKIHVCDECGKSYWQRGALRVHKKQVHLGIRHTCEVCGETFVSMNVLKRHNLIHTGERPFVCVLCGQAFRQREVLAAHVRSHEAKGDSFRPNGPMREIRKRVTRDQ